jgi:hypothetical protein
MTVLKTSFVLIALFGFSRFTNAAISNSEIIEKIKCSNKVAAHLTSEMKWTKIYTEPKEISFKALNEKTRNWIILSIHENNHSKMWIEKDGEVTNLKFDKNCAEKREHFKVSRFSYDTKDDVLRDRAFKNLDDRALNNLVQSKNLSLVYVWSPEMLYSSFFHENFKKIAMEHKINFISVVDPTVTSKQLRTSVSKYNISVQPLIFKSNDLFLRGALEHMPMTFLVGKGNIWGAPIIGAMDGPHLSRILKDKLSVAR